MNDSFKSGNIGADVFGWMDIFMFAQALCSKEFVAAL
jgi:hypothetical protein